MVPVALLFVLAVAITPSSERTYKQDPQVLQRIEAKLNEYGQKEPGEKLAGGLKVLEEARKIQDKPALAKALLRVGIWSLQFGKTYAGIDLLTEASQLYEDLKDPAARANVLLYIGLGRSALGQRREAIAF